MSIFVFGKQKAKEQAIDKEDFEKMLKITNKYLIPSSIPQPDVQILTTSREIKHLKKQIWKFSHR